MLDELLRAFIQHYGLDPAMHLPLESLLRECMLQLSQTLDPQLEADLSTKASWKPVDLKTESHDSLPSAVTQEDEDPIIYPTFDQTEAFQSPMAPSPTLKTPIPPDLERAIKPSQPTTLPPAFSDDDDERDEDRDTQTLPTLASFQTNPGANPANPAISASSSTAGFPTLTTEPPHEEDSANITSSFPAITSTDESLMLSSKVARYHKVSRIGEGGMSEIWRVQDKDLNRHMAMKLIKRELNNNPAILSRFIEEAQITAQLEHPGIVPVHEFGRLVDGRFYFTMKEIQGKTLTAVIREVHEAIEGDHWGTTIDGWNLWRLLDLFKRICEAVGYAHSHRVIHRDLKPDNVIVGEHGEVCVVDWGLAKQLKSGSSKKDASVPLLQLGEPNRLTMPGDLIGTPAYMPPEQIAAPQNVDERSDVYALGAILYQILAGQAPYLGYSTNAILFQMLSGPPHPPGRSEELTSPSTQTATTSNAAWQQHGTPPSHTTEKPLLPAGLLDICAKAMHRTIEQRYTNANDIAKVMGEWLDGSQKRMRALELYQQAQHRSPEIRTLRTQAAQRQKQAQELALALEPWDPEEAKQPIWKLEDEAHQFEQKAQMLELEIEQLLQGALIHTPDLEEAHDALAVRLLQTHQHAETNYDLHEAQRTELLLRQHSNFLPRQHPRRIEITNYLQGDGLLTLRTNPPGAPVVLFRYEETQRRMEKVFVRALGTTPLEKIPLPMGSYVIKISAPGYQDVQYPVRIRRGEHWHNIHPDTGNTHIVPLPPLGRLAHDDCFVPGGFFWVGGDPDLPDALPGQLIWLDDFVIKKYPVTFDEYYTFINELTRSGREEDARRFAPKDSSAYSSEETAIFSKRETFSRSSRASGHGWQKDWPVVNVNWFGALAYSHWWSQQTQERWRLPFELEWEKAARGVDARRYPWGNHLDPSWCHMRDSQRGSMAPASIESYPVDTSVYGVRHMAGNVMDWCMDSHRREGPPIANDIFRFQSAWENSLPHAEDYTPETVRRLRRGGSWASYGHALRTTHRHWSKPHFAYSLVGFRLARNCSF